MDNNLCVDCVNRCQSCAADGIERMVTACSDYRYDGSSKAGEGVIVPSIRCLRESDVEKLQNKNKQLSAYVEQLQRRVEHLQEVNGALSNNLEDLIYHANRVHNELPTGQDNELSRSLYRANEALSLMEEK